MFEEEDDELFDAQFNLELERFEKMLKEETALYFDPDVLEQIIDHFIIKNQLKKGLVAINYAKEQFPNHTIFDLRKAQVFSTTGKLKESVLLLQDLEKTDPYNAEVFITKASVFSQLRDHDRAIKYFEKALDVAQDNNEEEVEDIRFDLALEYENVHDYMNAIKVLEEILVHSPENESAIYEIAYCYERTGDLDKCIEFYQRYIDGNPYSFTAWYNLGNIYFLKNNTEKALWAYDYSVIINEEFSSAHFNMGNTYMQIGEYQKALESYEKCLEIDGHDALTLSYLAEAYERLERFDEAMDFYNQSLEENEELAEPWLGIGIIKDIEGKTKEAISYLSRAVSIQPENSNFRLVLAEALYKDQRLVEAETECEKAFNLDNTYAEAAVLLAKIKSEYSLDEALDFLLKIENLSDMDSSVRVFLSVILWKLGQKTESVLIFKKEYMTDSNCAKKLFLYLPEAEHIPDFVQIIES